MSNINNKEMKENMKMNNEWRTEEIIMKTNEGKY